jgi:hypothetical protein
MKNKKITGWWGNEPIWRDKTPEEKIEEVGISPNEVMVYLSLLANKNNKNYEGKNN